MENTNITPQKRSVPLRLRLTESEDKQLKILAKKAGRPPATVAHALLIKALNNHS